MKTEQLNPGSQLAGRARLSVLVAMSVAVTACVNPNAGSTNAAGRGVAPPPPLDRPLQVSTAPIGANTPPENSAGPVTLSQALSLALKHNFELQASEWKVKVAEAHRTQAGAIPNPEFETEIDEFGGSGKRDGFDGAEFSFLLKQEIELGGKRGKRMKVAELERDISRWEHRSKQLDVLAETKKAFVRVLAAKNKLRVAENEFDVIGKFLEVVSQRTRAGLVSPLEETRSQVAVATSRIALERSRRAKDLSRRRLAAAWGSTEPGSMTVEGKLENIVELVPLERLMGRISNNPEIAQTDTRAALGRAILQLEKSKNVPDITVSAGVKRFEDDNDSAFVVGFSIPIPVFGLNPGGEAEAISRLKQSGAEKQATVVQVRTALRRAYQIMSSSYQEIFTLFDDVMQAARKAFDAVQLGYEKGNTGLLEVLDAQRILFGVHGQYIDALSTYRIAIADVERLIGGAIVETPNTPN